jgi:uridine kinase
MRYVFRLLSRGPTRSARARSRHEEPGSTVHPRPLQIIVDGRVRALLPSVPRGRVDRPLAAIFNRRLVSLSYELRGSGDLAWVTMADRTGWDVYRRTACLMMVEAARRLDPDLRLVLHQTHGDGLYHEVRRVDAERFGEIRPAEVRKLCKALEAGMREICREDLPVVVHRISVEESRDWLREQALEDKVNLLRTHWESSVRMVSCGGFADLFHAAMADATGVIRSFRVVPYSAGLLLRVPVRGSVKVQGPARVGKKLFAAHVESRAWIHKLGVANLGQLNALCVSGGIEDLVRVAEGVHEKQLARIADEIARRRGRVRVVLVAGPSSSGKTTFVKRLDVQLRVNGLQPVALSVDNFFVARARTPRDETGQLDFECLEALDLKLFNHVLRDLLHYGEARVPRYDFHTGKPTSRATWKTQRLAPDEVLLIEGIHALNPALTLAVPLAQKFKIYISPLTQLSIDDHNRIFTSDTRLIRRITRDRRYRGYSAAETIHRWPMVRRGEMKHIFPYREQADALFNSALVYEHAVLRNYVERYLLEVDEHDDASQEAYRLLGFLRRVVPVLPDAVPHNSLLREFIGDSAFHY